MDTQLSNSNMTIQFPTPALAERLILLVESECISEPAMAEKFNQLKDCSVESVTCMDAAIGILKVVTPDLLVLSVDTLCESSLKNLRRLKGCSSIPVVVFAKEDVPNVAQSVIEAGVTTYIVDDVLASRLPLILDLAFARFTHMQKVHNELETTRKKLVERKLIEKAKGIVMRQKNYSEDQAYTEIRRLAMNQGQAMAELAEKIISLSGHAPK